MRIQSFSFRGYSDADVRFSHQRANVIAGAVSLLSAALQRDPAAGIFHQAAPTRSRDFSSLEGNYTYDRRIFAYPFALSRIE